MPRKILKKALHAYNASNECLKEASNKVNE